jgi:two-component system alkaline phosphatase synthesis response regulator PhoP
VLILNKFNYAKLHLVDLIKLIKSKKDFCCKGILRLSEQGLAQSFCLESGNFYLYCKMSPKKILLVEDEEHLLKTIQLNLELEGYAVIPAVTGIEALKEFRKNNFDLVILDVMLPEINGFDVCEQIRKENTLLPVLFLTAQGSSSDRIRGLKLGADDYLTKPFNLEELLLRVQILLNRIKITVTEKALEFYTFGDNAINFINYEIKGVNEQKIEITKREIALLKLLIEREGEVISREEILDAVWGMDVYPSSRTIDNYILAFRKYFEKNQKEPQHFHSIRGVGYKFIG